MLNDRIIEYLSPDDCQRLADQNSLQLYLAQQDHRSNSTCHHLNKILLERLREALKGLSDSELVLIDQIFWKRKTCSQLAALSNCEEGEIDSRLKSILELLRLQMTRPSPDSVSLLRKAAND